MNEISRSEELSRIEEIQDFFWDKLKTNEDEIDELHSDFLNYYSEATSLVQDFYEEEDPSFYDITTWERSLEKFELISYSMLLQKMFLKFEMETKKDFFFYKYVSTYNSERLDTIIKETIEFLSTRDMDDSRSIKLINKIVRCLYNLKNSMRDN